MIEAVHRYEGYDELTVFSAPHPGQRIPSGLPHSAQNRLAGKLSVPHLEQSMFPAVLCEANSSSSSLVAQALACDAEALYHAAQTTTYHFSEPSPTPSSPWFAEHRL